MTPAAGATPTLARISDYVDLHARLRPEADALVLDDRRWNYRCLKQQVDDLARALLAAGVRRGDRVATLATPHPDYFVAFLATASIGAIWVGLNPRYRTEELAYAVGDSQPSILLTRTRIGERGYGVELAAIRAASRGLRQMVVLNDDPLPADAISLKAFIAAGDRLDEEELSAARAATEARDPCMIVYTSGSTGKPKGAMLHHQGVVSFSLEQNRVWPLDPLRLINFLPINHVGCVVDISTPVLTAGGTLFFMEQFEPRQGLELMQREGVSFWASVPSTFQMQLALPDFDRFDLSAVQLIVWEGAAMPEEHIKRLAGICPRMATNYGMTETTSGITVVEPTDDLEVLANSVGRPYDDLELRLVDGAGRDVPDGEAGEIQVRSARNMLGYWNRPTETAATIDSEGWLATGDLARRREDGGYQLVGRLKEMYKSGGYNVYPREVEAVLESHPAVDVAAVVAIPDPKWQEVGIAYVTPRVATTAEELLSYCRERMANYKVPKVIRLVDSMPLLPIGKIDKVALRRQAQEEFQAG